MGCNLFNQVALCTYQHLIFFCQRIFFLFFCSYCILSLLFIDAFVVLVEIISLNRCGFVLLWPLINIFCDR